MITFYSWNNRRSLTDWELFIKGASLLRKTVDRDLFASSKSANKESIIFGEIHRFYVIEFSRDTNISNETKYTSLLWWCRSKCWWKEDSDGAIFTRSSKELSYVKEKYKFHTIMTPRKTSNRFIESLEGSKTQITLWYKCLPLIYLTEYTLTGFALTGLTAFVVSYIDK